MLNTFLNILFPQSCPLCSRPSTDHKTAPICPDCWHKISPYRGHICQRCGKPLISDVSITCGDCITEEPLFKHARSYGLYKGGLRKAINLLKYHGLKRLARPLSDLLHQLHLPSVDAVVPVPLYKKRLRLREFNQSALLARHAAKRLNAPLITDCLIKSRDTLPQVGLSAKDRRENIRKAFEVRNSELIKEKSVILIDDVITTGATVRECSKALKKAGSADIYVITLAHGALD